MHKVLRWQPWTCAKCLRRQRRSISSIIEPASTRATRFEDAYIPGKTSTAVDDNILRDMFNNQSFWYKFSRSAKTTSGLIGNKYLSTPKGFQSFAEESLRQCKKLVDRTLAASTHDELRALPRDLDRLSDLLCRVIDLSDFIRSNHPDQKVQAAATASYSTMLQYMNQLNTMTGLNDQLKKATSIPEVRAEWSEEEKIVAQILMKDFAKSGIDLPGKQRQEFVALSNEISEVGTDFTTSMEPYQGTVVVHNTDLQGLSPTYLGNRPFGKNLRVPIYSPIARAIMGTVQNSAVRKELYIAERTASKRTIGKLERLLIRRAELANLTGYSSFAQMTLADKMSKTPTAVMNFLQSLHNSNRGSVEAESSQLAAIKHQLTKGIQELKPWDHNYLLNELYKTQTLAGTRIARSRLRENAKSYFALGHVMQGLFEAVPVFIWHSPRAQSS